MAKRRPYTLKLTRISDGPVGDRIWWFGDHVRIRRVPAAYSSTGHREYHVDFLPTPDCMRSRYERVDSWREARHIVAFPVDTQL